jgi:glycosyltransferase involved in cell wall biosynthesis
MNNFLFNFSSSYSGGGLKRLMAYLEWFDNNGGAHFIVNFRIKKLSLDNKNNVIHYADSSKIRKALNDQNYLVDIARQVGADIDLYYSYGIPVPYKVGKVNWFHLSNVLPLIDHSGYGLHLLRSIELKWLGVLIRKNYKNAEVLSAESNYSLSLFPLNLHHNLVVSPNGSDEEIELFERSIGHQINDIAIIVGTFFYKNLDRSYNVFLKLQAKNSKLRLIIIGDKTMIPQKIKNDQRVDAIGEVSHNKVIALLSSARFYINMSKVENSWNSSSEGALLAQESFISDIKPHIELLDTIACDKYIHNNSLLHFEKRNLTLKGLPVWPDVIADMIKFTD